MKRDYLKEAHCPSFIKIITTGCSPEQWKHVSLCLKIHPQFLPKQPSWIACFKDSATMQRWFHLQPTLFAAKCAWPLIQCTSGDMAGKSWSGLAAIKNVRGTLTYTLVGIYLTGLNDFGIEVTKQIISLSLIISVLNTGLWWADDDTDLLLFL